MNTTNMNATKQIDEYIEGFSDWRGERLAHLRRLINKAAPEAKEEWKWNCPVWTQNGLLVAISGFKNHVKINFLKGAYLEAPKDQFNSGLDSKMHRSINFSENDEISDSAIKSLIRSAVAHNTKM